MRLVTVTLGVFLVAGWLAIDQFRLEFCWSDGFFKSSERIEAMRPALLELGRSAEAGNGAGLSIVQTMNSSLDLLKDCYDVRDEKYCLYAGSDSDGAFSASANRKPFSEKEAPNYRYIVRAFDLNGRLGVGTWAPRGHESMFRFHNREEGWSLVPHFFKLKCPSDAFEVRSYDFERR